MAWSTYYTTPAWYALRDRVRQRARNRCEFCQHRSMQHVHHRTYVRFGQERLSDLMAVCTICHRAAHGRGPQPTGAKGSLLVQGDSGFGLPRLWLDYLRRCSLLVGKEKLS